jgi:branched-chain amino acid transport system ATP-binding protein
MLVLDDITAGYGGATVLRQVSLTVPPGSIVALIGPNGAGKTTLLRVASGLLRPTHGRVVLDGSDVTRTTPNRRAARGLCHVTEGRAVFPALTVRENLAMFSPSGKERDGIALAIEAFSRLATRLDQVAGTMSGGEQQMLALARAYVRNPRIVLLDEVSLGLAPIIVDEIFEFLSRLAAGGSSLLLVEQFVTKALAVADYVYLLDRGSLVFAGEPSELDGHDFFATYVGAGMGAGIDA